MPTSWLVHLLMTAAARLFAGMLAVLLGVGVLALGLAAGAALGWWP